MTIAHRALPASDPSPAAAAALVVSAPSAKSVCACDGAPPSFAQAPRASPVVTSGEVVIDGQLASALVVLARLFAPFVAAEIRNIRQTSSDDAWIDQESSPLGRRMHCSLARRGVLAARKVGRRWMVRRADLEAFIAAQKGGPSAAAREECDGDEEQSARVRALLAGCDLDLATLAPSAKRPQRISSSSADDPSSRRSRR